MIVFFFHATPNAHDVITVDVTKLHVMKLKFDDTTQNDISALKKSAISRKCADIV